MSTIGLDTLYDLLPAVYRLRDAERAETLPPGALPDEIAEPLRALLSVIAGQAAILEENIAQLDDDQFVETCAEWVVPYIGDLVGARPLHTPAGSGLSDRADVANTIAYRRRKGTAAVLEQLARDVTGWDAHAVEFFQRLMTTQYMNHIRPDNIATPDLRAWEPLERLTTPFDTLNHTLEVRRISPRRGFYNIPNVGIFLWRLRAYSATDVTPHAVDFERFHFDPAGSDAPIYTLPETERTITHLAEPANVPLPISRRVLDANLDRYYGLGKSLRVTLDDTEVPPAQIRICDLSDVATGWAHTPRSATVGIDPVLGRLVLPVPVAAASPTVRVSFHYGFAADVGGGEYDRTATLAESLEPVVRVPDDASLASALSLGAGVVEITDNGTYDLPATTVSVDPNRELELRAAAGCRPLLRLGGDLTLTGGDEAGLTINGLRVLGGRLVAEGGLRRLAVRHCTLVPAASASLRVTVDTLQVEVDHAILGGIRAVRGADVSVVDSIVDAGAADAVAYAALDDVGPGGPLSVEATTMIGRIHTEALPLATNAVLLASAGAVPWDAPVRVERRQEGCVRFTWLPRESRVPRRYRCRPAAGDDQSRMRPTFTSLRYGDAGYCQLGRRCPDEIRAGADDESEMGAFHQIYQHQREANLRIRLDEYLRFGLEAGIFYAS